MARPINRTTLSWLRHACRIAPHDVRDAARLEAADMVAHGDIDLMPPSLQRIGMRWGMSRPELHRCSIAATGRLTPEQAEAELHRRLTPTALAKHLRRRWPNASQRTIDQHVSNVALALPHRKRTPRQRKLDDWLRQTQRNARAQQWAHRIGQELQRTNAAGWHAVLCTLTIAPAHVPPIARQQGYADADKMTAELLLQGLNPDGTRATGAGPWHRYRAKVQEAVRQAYNHQAGDGPRLPQSTPAHQYCRTVAVIEHGKSRHHHHIHALIMCRAIPASWTRPNELRIRDRARQIVTMAHRIGDLEAIWPWGISRCEPYRMLGDNWARLIPHTAHGPALSAPIHSGAYLAKYLRKESSLWPHRVRATHGLGLTGLRRYIAQLTTDQLHAALHSPRHDDHASQSALRAAVPVSLARAEADREYHRRLAQTEAGRRTLWTWATERTGAAYRAMLDAVEHGDAEPQRLDSVQLRNWLNQTLPDPPHPAPPGAQRTTWHQAEADWPTLPVVRARQLAGVPVT